AGSEALANLNQQGITRGMAQAVIENLESIDVDEQHREFEISVAPRRHQSPPQAIEKQRTIREIRQPVVERIVRQHLLGPLALRDVAVDDYQPSGLAIRSTNSARGGLKHSPRAIFVKDAILQAFTATRDSGLLSRLVHASAVLRVNLFQRRAGQIARSIAENLLVRGTVIKTVSVLVDHCNHIRGVFADELKELVAFCQLAAYALELEVLIDGVDIEEQYEGGKAANPLPQVQCINSVVGQ